MTQLLNPGSGKKQVKGWQPLQKLRWLQLNDDQLQPVANRVLVPVLGTEQHFVKNIPRTATQR